MPIDLDDEHAFGSTGLGGGFIEQDDQPSDEAALALVWRERELEAAAAEQRERLECAVREATTVPAPMLDLLHAITMHGFDYSQDQLVELKRHALYDYSGCITLKGRAATWRREYTCEPCDSVEREISAARVALHDLVYHGVVDEARVLTLNHNGWLNVDDGQRTPTDFGLALLRYYGKCERVDCSVEADEEAGAVIRI